MPDVWLLAALGFIGVGIQFSKNGFSPNLNLVNFIMLLLGMLLYGSPAAYMKAAAQSMRSATGIAIQFPLYGGIMGIVQGSGLGHMLADFFSSFATAHTLPFYTYLSSVASKLFVPSGGGEWAIEGPVMLQAAARLHARSPAKRSSRSPTATWSGTCSSRSGRCPCWAS